MKAYSSDKKEFRLDTVDEDLNQGTLKAGKSVIGIAVFAAENDVVYKATLIKISVDCK
ncbi:DUF4354 family protein [Xenorhabdus koppenhoeferi]|uniref:DUF4354 family protein n=1 Tax=Xenorhabdus koppenhoeferi TaxID=351659 RepID=UPI0030DB38DC